MEKTTSNLKNILITGVSGRIGSALGRELAAGNRVKGLYHRHRPAGRDGALLEGMDLQDRSGIKRICSEFKPDYVIHCAGIAHQGRKSVPRETYLRINCEAAAGLAEAAFIANPEVHFIHLSSVSVYGETGLAVPTDESHPCRPAGDYAFSKLAAEERLAFIKKKEGAGSLRILRLAPVYDAAWHFNLDRRVMLPGRFAFLRVGDGRQRLSALALPNLVDYIRFLIDRPMGAMGIPEIVNICDAAPYSFMDIIQTYQKTGLHSRLPVIWIPKSAVFLISRIWGLLEPKRKPWVHAVYEKMARSLVFDNRKMVQSGFQIRHTLRSVFAGRQTASTK
ncbi:MAG: NAD-dependent epimerase/dehydratase family protein [Thermodesulfobacteriota bacterium]